MDKEIGSLVLGPDGDLILLTDLAVVLEGPSVRNGHIDVSLYDLGVFLRGRRPVGAQAHIPCTEPLRVVAHVSDVLRVLERSGFDLSTPPAETSHAWW